MHDLNIFMNILTDKLITSWVFCHSESIYLIISVSEFPKVYPLPLKFITQHTRLHGVFHKLQLFLQMISINKHVGKTQTCYFSTSEDNEYKNKICHGINEKKIKSILIIWVCRHHLYTVGKTQIELRLIQQLQRKVPLKFNNSIRVLIKEVILKPICM